VSEQHAALPSDQGLLQALGKAQGA
jgi:hypothetical protein